MTNGSHENLTDNLTKLEDTMHQADRSRTLEEQVVDMKRRGIDPKENYKKWDDDDERDGWND